MKYCVLKTKYDGSNVVDPTPMILPLKKKGQYLMGVNLNFLSKTEKKEAVDLIRSLRVEEVPADDSLYNRLISKRNPVVKAIKSNIRNYKMQGLEIDERIPLGISF